MSEKQVIVVTIPTVPDYNIVKVLGTTHGITVRTRGVGGKIVAGIEGIFGGEVTSYTSEAEKARRDSSRRLIENAAKMGANAIVGADFETNDILPLVLPKDEHSMWQRIRQKLRDVFRLSQDGNRHLCFSLIFLNSGND